ncbi:hypothetical protein I8752_21070 [Nostocaceae cyanobacterium CENA369]|uniref:Uncharacterized protein n=1 Tax=Dendronalium phyllosphericum CENA369 TaxID=1725256 RepID=A0A8J7I5X1_9NOST|nr:hypothetical protein [Dendronalium phyllosphericum]MBH8575455.1 hypothetical protein [Dendronalium phyllosphericum CENA369]
MSLPAPGVPITTKAGMDFYLETAKFSRGFTARLREIRRIPGIANGLTSVLKRNAYLKGTFTKTDQVILKNKKAVDEARQTLENLLKKSPGKDLPSKGIKGGAQLAQVAILVGLVAVIAEKVIYDIQVQDMGFENDNYTRSEIQKAFDRYQRNVLDIRSLQKRVDDFNLQDQRTRDRLYGLENQLVPIRENANNALYEVRQGRVKLDKRIDDTNTNFLKLNTQVTTVLKGINTNFQSEVTKTIGDIQKSLTEAQKVAKEATSQTKSANDRLKKAEDTLSAQAKVLDTASKVTKALPASITSAIKTVQDTTKKIVDVSTTPINQSLKKWGITVTPATITPASITVSDTGGVTITPAVIGTAQVTYASFSTSDIGKEIIVDNRQLNTQISTLGQAISNVGTTAANAQTTANYALQEAKNKGSVSVPDLTPIKSDLSKLKSDVDTQKADLKKIEAGLKEQDRMNQEGNRKLDQIIPMLAGIPLIPGRTAGLINPNIPTPDGIANAAATGFCRTTQTGGCSRRMMDDVVGNINNNTNNSVGNAANTILGGVNAGANAALLQGQATILERLGDQVPGGISGKLERFSKWLHLDRLLNMMIFAATIHNALMLSNDIGQTLLGAINNVLQLFGLKDSEGNNFDLGGLISSSIENLIKAIVGADNYIELKQAWQMANRIYQATTNVLNQLMNVNSVITNALEVIGSYTGRIGNALRIWGVVGEKAYSWMNPQPSFDNKWVTKLQQLQEGANTVAMVAQIPVDTVNAVTELNNSTTELVKAVKQEPDTKNGIDVGEAAKVKTDQEAA